MILIISTTFLFITYSIHPPSLSSPHPFRPPLPFPQSQPFHSPKFSIYVYSSLNSINSSIFFFDLCRKKSFYKIEINIIFWFSENIQTLRLVLENCCQTVSSTLNAKRRRSICKVIDYTFRISVKKLKFSKIYRIFKLLCFCC